MHIALAISDLMKKMTETNKNEWYCIVLYDSHRYRAAQCTQI